MGVFQALWMVRFHTLHTARPVRGCRIPAGYVRVRQDTIVLRDARGVVVHRGKVLMKTRTMSDRDKVDLHLDTVSGYGYTAYTFHKDDLVEIM